jgi:hypothetical protein
MNHMGNGRSALFGRWTNKIGIANALGEIVNSVSGLSPETVAMIVVVGLVLGVFPVVGCATILCGMAAIALRISLPAVLLVNQLSSPLQFVLFLPLGAIGGHVWRAPITWGFVGVARDAVVGWLCICVPLGVLVYVGLLVGLRRFSRRDRRLPHAF